MSLVAVVDYSEEAKKYCCFNDATLKIFLKNEKGFIVGVMDYNEFNIERLKKREIPIIYREDTSSCRKIPKKMLILSRIFAGEVLD